MKTISVVSLGLAALIAFAATAVAGGDQAQSRRREGRGAHRAVTGGGRRRKEHQLGNCGRESKEGAHEEVRSFRR